MEFHFDLENPLPNSSDNFSLLFHTENDHMPSQTYLQTLIAPHSNLSARSQIVSLILHFSRDFDPLSSYLAVNYMDRFLSTHSIPDGKPWMLKLVAASCFSLALKMRKTDFSVSDFQHDGDIILDSVTVERMEMLILGALKWRMRSVNPFSFMSFFISFFQLKEQSSIQALKDRATHLIFKAQNDIKLLEFKPSIICASALLSAAHDLFPLQLPCFRNSISSCEYVNKEKLLKCYNVMQQVSSSAMENDDEYESMSSCTTPANVLDFQSFTSSTSDNVVNQTRPTTNAEMMRALKRRKYGDLI